jgi:hypothetical protein
MFIPEIFIEKDLKIIIAGCNSRPRLEEKAADTATFRAQMVILPSRY